MPEKRKERPKPEVSDVEAKGRLSVAVYNEEFFIDKSEMPLKAIPLLIYEGFDRWGLRLVSDNTQWHCFSWTKEQGLLKVGKDTRLSNHGIIFVFDVNDPAQLEIYTALEKKLKDEHLSQEAASRLLDSLKDDDN